MKVGTTELPNISYTAIQHAPSQMQVQSGSLRQQLLCQKEALKGPSTQP